MQFPPATCHAPPACLRFCHVAGFAEHLAFKHQQRIAAQHRGTAVIAVPAATAVGSAAERQGFGLGLGQQLNQPPGLGVVDRLLVHATHRDAMGDGRLLKQTVTGRGGRSQQQHRMEGAGATFPWLGYLRHQ